MPGGNPSADSVASTDPGGMLPASHFRYSLAEGPYRERHKALNPGGAGAKPLQVAPATNASL
jgi:hypothetical protein